MRRGFIHSRKSQYRHPWRPNPWSVTLAAIREVDIHKTLAIAVSIWLLACPGFTADLSKDVAVASQIQLLDAWIQTQMKYNGLPGLVIGIVHVKEVVWQNSGNVTRIYVGVNYSERLN